MKRIALIMAGGNGTRFWPASRKSKPKQFLALNTNKSLIYETIERINTLVSIEDIYIISNVNHRAELEQSIPSHMSTDQILYEPIARNTAPAIATATAFLKEKYKEAVMLVLPSDHHIDDVSNYQNQILKAFEIAESNHYLMTFGITPTFPATGYGYIKALWQNNTEAYPVSAFVEKPDAYTAQTYLDSEQYFWNSGMFIWNIDVFIASMKEHMPKLWHLSAGITDWHSQFINGDLNTIYNQMNPQSIDYGLMEKATNTYVLPMSCGWCDLGSWDALKNIKVPDKNGNITEGNHLLVDSKNNIVIAHKKLIATVDVEDLVIIETEDVIMVCPKHKAQDVKKIVTRLNEKQLTQFI